jgi:cytidine deaminase
LTVSDDRRGGRSAKRREDLIAAAREARERGVAPFSGFRVGAALEAMDGTVITGCNIENASYGLTLCAERVAIFKAVSEGHRAFRRMAIVADTRAPTAPCGACRQILWEYAGDIEVILASLERETGRYRMKRLLPVPFDTAVLSSPAQDRSAGTAPRPPDDRRRPKRAR